MKPDAYLSSEQISRWAGKPSDFKKEEMELAFQGLQQKRLLITAGWQSLRSYVDFRVSEIKD